jgi:hypothetical protein
LAGILKKKRENREFKPTELTYMSVTCHMLEQSVSAKANPCPARLGQCEMI